MNDYKRPSQRLEEFVELKQQIAEYDRKIDLLEAEQVALTQRAVSLHASLKGVMKPGECYSVRLYRAYGKDKYIARLNNNGVILIDPQVDLYDLNDREKPPVDEPDDMALAQAALDAVLSDAAEGGE